jgi:outer membrane cobalamin receptor
MLILLTLSLLDLPLYEMDEVVVTANRYPILLQDVAVAVMTIGRAEIEQLNALSLEEVLSAAAGIDLKSYGTPGGVTSISTRGIPTNGTLVLVNGQPMNAITNGIADLSVIDINLVERIEIVKGPVSSIYGANALGGVVNILTVSETREPSVKFGFMPATTKHDNPFQNTKTSVRLGLPIGYTKFNMAGVYTHDGGTRSNSELVKYHINCAITHTGNRLALRSCVFYDQKDYGIPGPQPRIDTMHPIPQFGDSTATSLFDQQNDQTIMGNISLDMQLSSNLNYYASIFANRQRTEFYTVYSGMIGDTVTEDYDYLVHKLGLNTMITLKTNLCDYALGVDARYDTLVTTVNSTVINDTTWKASSYEFGTWAELRLHISDRTSLNSSVRYDYNSQFGSFVSPSIGIVSVITPRLWLKLSAGKTFRAPTFNDLYWPEYGNPDLQPENGWAYELRAESTPWPTFFSALSIFIRNVDDRIAWMPGADDVWRPQNLNYLNVKGIDVEVKQRISDFLDYTIEATYLNARQKNEEIIYSYYDWMNDTSLTIFEEIERQAAFTPEFTLASKINFHLPAGINLNIAGQYLSKRSNYYPDYDDYPNVTMDTKYLSGHIIIHTSLTKKINRYLTIAAGMKNLTDTDYALQFGNTIDDLDYPMPRRTYFARVSLHSL